MTHDNDGIRYYVKSEELFDILNSTYIAIGHGGRDHMISEIKLKYCNITKETIMVFWLCIDSHKKSSNPKRGLVFKPILHSAYNSRAQIDLIYMQSQSINNYRFNLNNQDHLTNCVILKPLKTKHAEEKHITWWKYIHLLER